MAKLKNPTVGLCVTCLGDVIRPTVGFAAIRLLEDAGCRVEVPENQTCCGQPGFNSGDVPDARAIAKQVMDTFLAFDYVVVPSGSCAGMMRHHYPALFQGQPEEAAVTELASRIYEITEFLVEVCHLDALPSHEAGANRVVLHTSCAARREMGTHLTSRKLLSGAPGVTLIEQERESECCGFGGTFSVRHPDISAAIAGEKVDTLLATGADTLVSADCGCLMNLNGTLEKRGERLRGQHIATFLRNRQRSGANE